MRRRKLLRLGGTALAVASTTGVVSGQKDDSGRKNDSDEDSGMRDLPSENVPHASTGALPVSRSEVPTGRWIVVGSGWFAETLEEAKAFARWSESTVTIDGEEFRLDSFDDWGLKTDDEFGDVPEETKETYEYSIGWSHALQPKPKGTQFEATWDLEWTTDPTGEYGFPDESRYPFTNQITVVRNDD